MLDIIMQGRELWTRVPTFDVIMKREKFFQEGLEQHAGVVGNYEIWPGRPLIKTTADGAARGGADLVVGNAGQPPALHGTGGGHP